MYYTLEKRACFGGGSMESWWEFRSYQRKTAIGVLVGAKILKKGTKTEVKKYLEKRGFTIGEEIRKNTLEVIGIRS
jgi:hypothetical protein